MEPLRAKESDPDKIWSEEIKYLSMKNLMYYHMTYHHSKSIHLNHLIFLHIYLFGLFLNLVAIDKIGYVASICILLYCILNLIIFRLHFISWLYSIIIISIGFLSYISYHFYLKPSQFDVNYKEGIPFIIGFSLMLLALISQEFGHLCFEKFLPPTSLYHGFIAAPFLEFMALFVLCDCYKLYPTKLRGIKQAIQKKRNELKTSKQFNICYHCCKPQKVEIGSISIIDQNNI